MLDHRNELEKELQATIAGVLFYFEGPKIGRLAFTEMMGRLQKAKVHLENKRLGCVSGLHSCECLCDQGIFKCVENIRFPKRLHQKKERKLANGQ